MKQRIITFGLSFGVATLLHAIWIQVAARELYRRAIPGFATGPISWQILLGLAACLAAGLVVFVFESSKNDLAWNRALLLGGTFGLVLFGFSNLRNSLQLSDWQVGISLIDTIWGGVLAMATVALTRLILDKLRERKQ